MVKKIVPELIIVEIPYESGEMRFRYSRYLSEDGSRWIRHGLFRAYYKNGALASEGNYVDGAEQGAWRDYHENGELAAEGMYDRGQEIGKWKYWNQDGSEGDE